MDLKKIERELQFEFNARKAYNDFISIISKENPNNQEIENSIVYKALNLICQGKSNAKILTKGKILFRARILEIEKFQNFDDFVSYYGIKYKKINDYTVDLNGCDEYQSKEPPLSKSPSGRNNISGISYLYLSQDKYTACCEVKPLFSDLISLAKFEVRRDLKIINLSQNKTNKDIRDFCHQYKISPFELIELIINKYSFEVRNEKEYFVTQFITDIIRKCGFDGVQYISSLGDKTNYTLFNSYKTNIAFINSEIIECVEKNYSFMTLNKRLPIVSKSKRVIDKEAVERIKDCICFSFIKIQNPQK